MMQAGALVVLILCVLAVGGFAVISLKSGVQNAAEEERTAFRELEGLNRKIQFMDARIAELHNPNYLRRKAEEFNLGLAQPHDEQIVRVVRKRGHGPSTFYVSQPYYQTFDLAMIDALSMEVEN